MGRKTPIVLRSRSVGRTAYPDSGSIRAVTCTRLFWPVLMSSEPCSYRYASSPDLREFEPWVRDSESTVKRAAWPLQLLSLSLEYNISERSPLIPCLSLETQGFGTLGFLLEYFFIMLVCVQVHVCAYTRRGQRTILSIIPQEDRPLHFETGSLIDLELTN